MKGIGALEYRGEGDQEIRRAGQWRSCGEAHSLPEILVYW